MLRQLSPDRSFVSQSVALVQCVKSVERIEFESVFASQATAVRHCSRRVAARFAACLRQPSLPASERVDLSNFRPIHQRVIETKKQTKNNMQLKHHNTIDMQDYKAVTCV